MKMLVIALPLLLLGCGEKAKPTAAETQQAEPVAEPMAKADKDQSITEETTVTADTPVNSDNYEKVMEAKSREYEALEYKPVTLTGFTCGDNCYVEYQPHIEGGGDMTAICTAPICGEWERAGRLPALYANKKAGAKFGTAPQVDGSGKVMNTRYRAIIDLRLPS